MAATIAGITMTADCGKLVHQVWYAAKTQIDGGGREIVITDATANAMGERGVALLASAYENYHGSKVVVLHDAEMAMTSIIPESNLPTVMRDTNAINMSLPSNIDTGNDGKPTLMNRASLRNRRSRVAKSRHNEPPRPLNAWIIFRSYRSHMVKAENPTLKTCDISKILSAEWRTMTTGEKSFWKDQANQHLDMHRAIFPNYKFKPSSSAYKHRRHTVRQLAGIDAVNDADKPAQWIEESGLKNPNPGMPFVKNSGFNVTVNSVLDFGDQMTTPQHMPAAPLNNYHAVFTNPSSAAVAIDSMIEMNGAPFPLIGGTLNCDLVYSGGATDGTSYEFDLSALEAGNDAYASADLSAFSQYANNA